MAEFFQSGLGGSGTTVLPSPTDITNLGLSVTMSANAVTIALKDAAGSNPTSGSPVVVQFRNATETTGTPTQVTISAALSLVVSSGSTLGTVSAGLSRIYIYLINNAGTAELACAGSNIFDENSVVTTTAEGGAGAADSAVIMYSTTARTNVACRYIGFFEATEATAGTWATSASRIGIFTDCIPKSVATYLWTGANGYGSTDTKIRKWTNAITATDTGSLLTVENSAANANKITANRRCRIMVSWFDRVDSSNYWAISKNSTQPTVDAGSLTASTQLTLNFGLSNQHTTWDIANPGDVYRPHAAAGATADGSICQLRVVAEEI